MKKYTFKKYDKKFPELYRKEKTRLKKILPKNIEIEHIGSTAVLGLGGKGIIDILILLNKKEVNKVKKGLQELGYNFKPNAGDKNRLFFEKDYKYQGKTRRVHVHLTSNKKLLKKDVVVRDYLRENKKEIRKYSVLKKEATKICKGKGKVYQNYKKSFLDRLTKKILKITK